MFCILRCSSGGNEGWGNLFRLLIIRKYLIKYYKFKVLVIVKGNSKVKKYLKSKKINFIFLNKNNLKFEKKILSKLKFSELAIMEMLNPTIELQKLYIKKTKKLIILDDVLKNKYVSNILIAAQNTDIKPKKSLKTKFYSGYKYFPFNKNFEKYHVKKNIIKKKISKITVFLGGSLYEKILINVASKLKEYNNVKFIVGAELRKNFIKKIKDINNTFKIIYLPKNLPYIIFKSDVVISGGGYTKIETGFLGTPQISIAVHRHQLNLLKQFKRKFNINYLKISELNFLKDEIKKLTFYRRLNQHKNYKKYFKQNGIKKIISKII